jgi:hypothetical protein
MSWMECEDWCSLAFHCTRPSSRERNERTLADLKLLRPVCAKLGSRATLHVIETADHSFHVLKKSGRSDAEVLRELAETTVSWANGTEQIK